MKENKTKTVWSAFAALAAAVLASSCCIGPMVLAVLGAGSFGFATALAPYRPYFLGLTFLLLAGAFYTVYRKPANAEACCAEEAACAVGGQRRNKTVLWVVTALVLGAAAFPQIEGYRNRVAQSGSAAAGVSTVAPSHRLTFTVEGMTCAACATDVERELKSIPGVADSIVSFKRKQAVVAWKKRKPSEKSLARAVKKAGYRAVFPHESKKEGDE